jgi:RND family efflux transporter MFP subunit
MRPLAVLLVSAITGCAGDSSRQDPPPAVNVATVRVERAELPERIEAGGVIRARASALLASRILAPIVEVRVAPGDRVRRGQVLVLLDDRDLSAHAQRAVAETLAVEESLGATRSEGAAVDAAATLARATHDRISGLHGRGSATAQELDEAVANLRQAEARSQGLDARIQSALAAVAGARAAGEAARVAASFASVTAPFDGVVTEKLAEPGNMAVPGSALLRVEDTSGLEVEALLDESRASSLGKGSVVQVALDGGAGEERVVVGRVLEIARAVEADRRALRVKVGLPPDTAARPGGFARIRFDGPLRSTLRIPHAAVVRHGQVTSVFVVDQGVIRIHLVGLGRVDGNRVEVLAGLDADDELVASPSLALSDGQPVVTERLFEGGQ